MARHKREDRLPPFVPLPWKILNSSAYQALRYASAKALPFFMGKPKSHYDSLLYYSTEFSFSYAEAERLGFARGTFSKVIRDVIETGFVDPVEKGGLRGTGKSCNLYRLSKRWREHGKPSFERLLWEEYFPRKAV